MHERNASPASFVALVFGLAIPFWIYGAATGGVLLPGLPVSALMFVTPAIAALALAARGEGASTAIQFVARAVDVWRTRPGAVVVALAAMPFLTLGAWGWMTMAGVDMPDPDITMSKTLSLFALFWIAGAAEELGWSGYLANPVEARWGFLGASLIIGLVWALWHVVPLLQAGRDQEWIAWWTLGAVATRMITQAVFRWSNDSVFAVSVLHAAQNTAWQCFPSGGSHFDPSYAAPMFALGAAVAAAVYLLRA